MVDFLAFGSQPNQQGVGLVGIEMGFSLCSSCFGSICPGFGIEETIRKTHFHPPQLPFITNWTKQVNVKN